MALPVSILPTDDRPRERLWSLGPAALTTAELLAILLGTGGAGQDVLGLAAHLLGSVRGRSVAWRDVLVPNCFGPLASARPKQDG
jgi:DNA repair protein RadC